MIKKPMITAATTEGQLEQIRRYLEQLATDINRELETMKKSIEKVKGKE